MRLSFTLDCAKVPFVMWTKETRSLLPRCLEIAIWDQAGQAASTKCTGREEGPGEDLILQALLKQTTRLKQMMPWIVSPPPPPSRAHTPQLLTSRMI